MHHPLAPIGAFLPSQLQVEADTQALGEQLRHCKQGVGRWFGVQCAAESVRGYIGARFFSIVFFSAVMIGAVSMYG